MKKKAVKLDKTSEHIPTCNRFSILESDEIPDDEDDETNIQIDSPSISPPKTNHKAKRRRNRQIINILKHRLIALMISI